MPQLPPGSCVVTVAPRGRGYMPKGGVSAAEKHNRAFRQMLEEAKAEQAAAPVAVSAVPVESRGRARMRVGSWFSTAWLARVGAVTGSLALLVELVR